MMQFTVAPNVGAAIANMDDNRAYYLFDGDLSQMGTIYRRLLEAGFSVVKSNVYPGFPKNQEDEYKRALEFVYNRRVDGWWSQRHKLIQYGICMAEEFQGTLRAWNAR